MKAASDVTFHADKTHLDLIGFLMILDRPFFSNNSEQNPIHSLCLTTRRLYNTMQYANKSTTDYLVRFFNTHKANEACNGSLITRDVK